MPLFLEVPEPQNKADQLIGLLDADVAGEPLWPPRALRVLVCVARSVRDTEAPELAWIVDNEERFKQLQLNGQVYVSWLYVPLGRVLEQHPTINVTGASPQTRMKPVYK